MILHPEGKNITAPATTETMIYLLVLVNGKRRCSFRMKGAEASMVLPSLLQLDMLSDDLNNICCLLYLFFGV
jgi:hypothetical protein